MFSVIVIDSWSGIKQVAFRKTSTLRGLLQGSLVVESPCLWGLRKVIKDMFQEEADGQSEVMSRSRRREGQE